jgi:hypothetical protein
VIVVSTDIVAALYLPGENTEIAETVLKRDPAWASPMSLGKTHRARASFPG